MSCPHTANVTVDDVDPFDPDWQQDPHPTYARWRQTSPVVHLPGANLWFVTRHDLAMELLHDTASLSNRRPVAEAPDEDLARQLADIRADGWPHHPVIADADPPEHDTYREIVEPFFTRRALAPLEDIIEQRCHDLIDQWPAEGHVEFVRDFAEPLPLYAMATLLDLPSDRVHLETYARWRDDAVAAVGSASSRERRLHAEAGVVEMQHFFAQRLDGAGGGEDLYSALVDARVPDPGGVPRPLQRDEQLTILRQVFIGGIETTSKALTEAMVLLHDAPDAFSRCAQDRMHRRKVVEEVLRLSSPAQGLPRIATRDLDVEGVHVPAGARVMLMFSAANRDAAVYESPDTFDPTRSDLGLHLAFGRGPHFCLGAPLARQELRTALKVLASRVTSYQIDPEAPRRYEESFVLRGLHALHLHVEPARSTR